MDKESAASSSMGDLSSVLEIVMRADRKLYPSMQTIRYTMRQCAKDRDNPEPHWHFEGPLLGGVGPSLHAAVLHYLEQLRAQVRQREALLFQAHRTTVDLMGACDASHVQDASP
jgi:hypothetical protein